MKKSTYKSVVSLIEIAQHAIKMSKRPIETEHDKQISEFFKRLAQSAINEADTLLLEGAA